MNNKNCNSMINLTSLYIASLKKIDWQDISGFNPSEEISLRWLLETGSLSRRLEEKCQVLSVSLLQNVMIDSDKITSQEKALLGTARCCLLREVVLRGDNDDWVIGRTLIPKHSLEKQPHNLMQQGTTPLGLTVFSVDDVSRDQLQFGWAELPHGKLIARRSRLWMNQKPMLVSELFLPSSPIYSKEMA